MLTVFQISILGLELSLDLTVRTDGPVDLMNRPPPIVFIDNADSGVNLDWIVQVIKKAVFHTRLLP